MEKTGSFWQNQEKLNVLNIEAALKTIEGLYHGSSYEIALMAALQTLKEEGKFALAQYPALQKKIDEVIAKLHANIQITIVNAITSSWYLSNRKNNMLLDRRLASANASKIAKQILYNPNLNAYQQFLHRKDKGLNLSERIWNSLEPWKMELEAGLGLGISKGQDAAAIARDLKQYQLNPDKLFRRVRDAEGVLQLSKKAREYHPGQGVYRSSYKNALRLTATETNIAYRTSDNLRWQSMPFVTAIKIELSGQHHKCDMCDKLQGEYPKDFIFKGWHPFCMCYAIPRLISKQEYNKYEKSILGIGEAPGINLVEETPSVFNEFIKNNYDRINNLNSTPYWFSDNSGYVKNALAA